MTGFRVWIGYGTGMDRGMDGDTLSGPAFHAMAVKEESGVFQV